MPVDSVLKGFRERAGLPAPGTALGGWSRETSEPTFGQWVSGLARLSRVLGEQDLAARAVELRRGLRRDAPGQRQDRHGYLRLGEARVRPRGHGRVRRVRAGTQAALEDRPGRRLRRDAQGPRPATTLPGPGRPSPPSGTRCRRTYTAVFSLAGTRRWRSSPSRWHYDAYWDRFAPAQRTASPGRYPVWLHAYSHVNTLASAAAVYDVYHDPRYLSILRNAYDWMIETQCYATGGYGPCRADRARPTAPSAGPSNGATTPPRSSAAHGRCSSCARSSSRRPARPVTSGWAENLLYNGLGAAPPVRPAACLPTTPTTGSGGRRKLPYWEQWPCCSGTYVQAVAHIPDLIYHGTDDGVAVSPFCSVPGHLGGG